MSKKNSDAFALQPDKVLEQKTNKNHHFASGFFYSIEIRINSETYESCTKACLVVYQVSRPTLDNLIRFVIIFQNLNLMTKFSIVINAFIEV